MLLLAVVAHVDTGRSLHGNDCAQRLAACLGDRNRVDAFAAGTPDEKAGQVLRPRQASGVRGQYPLRAAPHVRCYFSRPVF